MSHSADEHRHRTYTVEEFAAKRSLYGIEQLTAYPDAVALLVSSAKEVDAIANFGMGEAFDFAPRRIVGVTYPNNAQAVADADLAKFVGREVIVIARNNRPSERWADVAIKALRKVGAGTVRRWRPPPEIPEGYCWDSPLPGVDADALVRSMLEAPMVKPTDVPPASLIKSSAEFVAGFIPPEYVVVGLLQRRFFYSLTAPTGHGKTAVMLLLAAAIALARLFAGRETKKARVLYLAAENADDVRMRWIALAQLMGFDINTIEVYFVEGRFKLSKSLQRLRAEAEKRGGEFGLVIVDTGPTFFEGKEENENKQLGDHARLLRSLINAIPGGPCVVAACHPFKHAKADDLLPRGGGAYLAEVDGNLTCWKTDSTVELHWQGKFRGPDFAPMNFLIKTVTHQDIRDRDGRFIPTVTAEYISEEAKEEIATAAREHENRALKFIGDNPSLTYSTLAIAMGWKLQSGEPNKMRAKRLVDELEDSKLVKKTRAGRYKITDQGKKVLKGEAEE
jgi:hypothetical protein